MYLAAVYFVYFDEVFGVWEVKLSKARKENRNERKWRIDVICS